MNEQQVPFDKLTATRFVRAVKDFARSEYGWQAKFMFAGLIALLLGINGTNVLNSYVGRDFMTAIEHRNRAQFIEEALLYIGVFAASTVVAVISRFTEERLGLLWREFLTRLAINKYLDEGTYYRLQTAEGLANPDERIAEDIRAFTVTTLSFVLMLLNSAFTVIAFSSVLWLISPLLFGVAVIYAACGSYVTLVLSRPLIKLNNDQLDKEANFRSGLIHVRENAESILLARREDRLKVRLLSQLENFVANFRRITSVNRNVGFFTTGYNWLIQIIPALIVAPYFIAGQIEFGVITQSAMAFTLIVNALSLIVSQVQSLSNFAAVVDRLNSLVEALERKRPAAAAGIETSEEDRRVAYEELTLLSPVDGQPVLKDLSISIPSGSRTLISGGNETGKAALFRATAGLWTSGKGRILRPPATGIYFLGERPYLPPGTLREVLVATKLEHSISDGQITALLHELDLDPVLVRAGGLNIEQDWGTLLSLSEQQILAVIHVLLASPHFAFLDRIGTALNSGQVRKILEVLSKNSITYINIGESDDLRDLYDAILEIGELGTWR
jgi:vitamin B12/bleomycin/antimicrobial peptide transport system ATP-binding/permease protein